MKTVVQCVNKRFDYIYNEVERNAKIDAVYSIDNEKKGALKTFLQMSKDYKYSEYKLHLQDDIVIADNLKDYLPNDIITLDGIRAQNKYGWWLIRASNTEAAIVVRFEGSSQKNKDLLLLEVEKRLKDEGLTWELNK